LAGLACQFADKIRLYDWIVSNGGSRLFIATHEKIPVSTEVELTIRIGRDPDTLTVPAKVVASPTAAGATGRQTAGLWVELAGKDSAALLNSLQIRPGESAQMTARRATRVGASTRAQIEKPLLGTVRTTDVSEYGTCLAAVLPAQAGETIKLGLELEGETVPLCARVAWQRHDICRTGVEFRFQSDSMRTHVFEAVQRMRHGANDVPRPQPTVLVVDNDSDALRTLGRLLTAYGYGTNVAASGLEALSIARRTRPALILLDTEMPGMDSVEVCSALKRDAMTSLSPVALMGAAPEAELLGNLDVAGALVGLAKPLDADTLRTVVENVIGQQQALVVPEVFTGPLQPRAHRRLPAFIPSFYESDAMRLETWLRDVSEGGGFLAAFWGDPPGTRARLTITNVRGLPLELGVEVVRHAAWGLAGDSEPSRLPGMGVRFLGGPGKRALERWIAEYAERLERKPFVLLVDDDPAYRTRLKAALEREGVTVASFSSPAGVSSAVAFATPDVVMLDHMMPGLDASQLCRMLKTHPQTSHSAVWIHSPLSETQACAVADDAGADGFAAKSEDPEAVARRLLAYLDA
jgi:CheY-like chemotaxis protein/Tfp pilus assembly protein PilZ